MSKEGIIDMRENHKSSNIDFGLVLSRQRLEEIQREDGGIMKKFRLSSSISISNMVLFDSDNKLRRYSNVKEIMEYYYILRLQYYNKRKEYLISKY